MASPVDLSAGDWTVLILAAAFIGVAKTALAGIGSLSVALFAVVVPARESTGAILPLLMIGDVLGVATYWRDADWRVLARLAAPVVVGVLVGVGFVAVADDVVMRRTIGVILLTLVAVHLLITRRGVGGAEGGHGRAWAYGGLAGFTTMAANAAGPVASLYLLSARLDRQRFLGTMAWLFATVNLVKLPFSAGLGLVSADSLLTDLLLVPAVVVGAVVGRLVVKRLDQRTFEILILVFTVLASLNLLR